MRQVLARHYERVESEAEGKKHSQVRLKTHLQHLATTAAINFERIVAWLNEIPWAKTRTSRFAKLAPLPA